MTKILFVKGCNCLQKKISAILPSVESVIQTFAEFIQLLRICAHVFLSLSKDIAQASQALRQAQRDKRSSSAERCVPKKTILRLQIFSSWVGDLEVLNSGVLFV